MNYTIKVTYQGGRENHLGNALANLDPSVNMTEYNSREEACEAIYAALYDVIDSESGCEMVARTRTLPDEADDDVGDADDVREAYDDECHAYIMREGYATEDGVTATVEEINED